MKQRIIASLLIAAFVITTIGGIIPLAIPVTQDSSLGATNNHFEVADGEIGNLIVPVLADEVVTQTYPDSNWVGNNARGGLWVGHETTDGIARTWLMFNLSHIPKEIGFVRATLVSYLNDEWNTTQDAPIGAYYAENDTWTEESLTWNNQPEFMEQPQDVISSPEGADMFVIGNWYQWDVTQALRHAFQTDMILSLVMKDENETAAFETWEYFMDADVDDFLKTYISIEYTVPGIDDITVDGISSAPLIDYIQNDNPQIAWGPDLNDEGDFQRDYQVEVWNNETFDDTLMFEDSHGTTFEVASGGVGGSNSRPFNTHDEMRYQMKWHEDYIGVGGIVDRLQFEVGSEQTCVFEDLTIYMLNIQDDGNLTADFDTNYEFGDPIIVLSRELYEPEYTDGWVIFDIDNVFSVSKDMNLLIEIRFRNNTGEGLQSPVDYDTGVGSVAYTWGPGALTSTVADIVYNRVHGLRLDIASTEVFETTSMIENDYPFGVDPETEGRFQMLYDQTLINDDGIIDRLYFRTSNPNGTVTYRNLQVYLLETPGFDYMSPIFEENYAGLEPMLVLEAESYTVANLGQLMMIDIDNVFHYSNNNDLLIEMRWEALVDGSAALYRTVGGGGYRAWNVSWGGIVVGNDTRTYEMYLDFIHNIPAVVYDGLPLANSTRYWIRARVMDSTGQWTSWNTQTFKYEVLTSGPKWESPVNDPNPATAGSPVTVSINVTHVTGVDYVLIEFGGTNHTMSAVGDTYSYEWSPALDGILNYTIYMYSEIGTSNTVEGSFIVNPPPTTPSVTTTTSATSTSATSTSATSTPTTSTPTTTNTTAPPLGDYTTIIIIIIVAGGVVLIIIIIVMKKRG